MTLLISHVSAGYEKFMTKLIYNLFNFSIVHINELAQERCNSVADALELRLSCANPSIWTFYNKTYVICLWIALTRYSRIVNLQYRIIVNSESFKYDS